MSTEEARPVTDNEESRRAPLTVGQLGMWLFISTEVMLFMAIIATYLIFRLSSLNSEWPGSSIMHVSLTLGLINTVLLVVSGITAWRAHRAASEDRPASAKIWLVTTILLGLAFLGIKSHEYQSKYKVGLLPIPGQKQLHDEANFEYLANVNWRLKSQIAELESKSGPEKELPEKEQETLDLYYNLKQHLVDITARHAGRAQNTYYGNLFISMMAWQIYPHPDTGRSVEVVLEPEFQRLQIALAATKERLMLVRQRHEMVKLQVQHQEAELEPFRLLSPTGDDADRLEEKKEWLETKKQQEQDLEVETRRLESALRPMQGRMDNLMSSFGPEGEILGVNERHDIRLPVVIPNGQAWISCYLLLTGTHALHLIAGLLVLIWWVPRKLGSARAPVLYVTCMYWQFVDAIWLAIFWLIYF